VTLLTELQNAALVDYIGVAAAKLPVLEQLYSAFCVNHLQYGTARAEAFRKVQREGGAAFERYATFEALAEHFRGDKSGHFPWHRWPAAYRDPNSPETASFARDHADRVTFHEYLQWEADRKLGIARVAGAQNGMSIGLYRNLALGHLGTGSLPPRWAGGEDEAGDCKPESEVAHYPRIMIAKTVADDALSSNLRSYFKDHIWEADDGPFYLHVLNELTIIRAVSATEQQLQNATTRFENNAKIIEQRFDESVDNPRHFEKMQWTHDIGATH